MTNADYIRRMDDATLLDFLARFEIGDLDYSITFCDLCEHTDRCEDCLGKWLKADIDEYNGLAQIYSGE